MITRRSAMAAGASLLAAAGQAGAVAQPPGLDALTRRRTLLGASLSPDGETIAVLRQQGEAAKPTAFVDLVRAADPNAAPTRVLLGEISVDGISWASNRRLLISLLVEREVDYVPTGSYLNRPYDVRFRRMMAVDVDGQNPVILFGAEKDIMRSDPDLSVVVDHLPDDPQHVLMRAWVPRYEAYALHQVDVATGKSTVVERGGNNTIGWETQSGRPVLRWDSTSRWSLSLLARAEGESEWKFVRKVRRKNDLWRPDFEIVGPTPDAGVFLALTSQPEDSAATLRRFDVRTLTVGDKIAARPDRDVESALIDEYGRFVAARYTNDRAEYDFADPAIGPHFRGMDRFFQGEASVNLVDFDRSQNRFLVRASGPRVPNAYYLYDRKAKRFDGLGLAMPWLPAEALAKAEALEVKTRDGTIIRAYLTVPLAAGQRPLVVLPHGGPEVRDRVEFDVFAQALAAQGWMVLQPNFRGSGGYGRAFADAGRKRWGDRMQEDVEDAVSQVIASGRADPNKVAVLGASYGGYAALMGAVRNPGLYKAAVAIAGVSDLPAMMDEVREDGEDSPVYQYWARTIGDPKTDFDALKKASPRARAAEIRAPVLLIHGLEDGVVPFKQSRLMAAALRSAGKPVEHVELKETGHGGWEPAVLKSILQQSTAFIAKAFV